MNSSRRRDFLKLAGAAPAAALAPAWAQKAARRGARPNVIIVLTDDQGYGDLSCHGNPVLKTPNMDRLHASSVRFTQFHSAPMCSPTRGQLMSGLDCLRNGAMATACGRSQMREGLPTMPQLFASGGYSTGIFGKWHLGYSYPHRPMDRGFQEAAYFLGFGLTGAGDYWDNDYFDTHYLHNGQPQRAKGYCTDIWFDKAMAWMDTCRRRREPFFCYLPTNAPHFPEWVAEKYSRQYEGKGPAPYFGMLANLDENLGRLETFLNRTGLRDNTILIFITDNGGVTGVKLHNAGMSAGKTSLLDGGHRVPCFVRWPAGELRHGLDIETQAQMQDLLPTLADLCGLEKPRDAAFDGASLAGLLKGTQDRIEDRMLVVQYYQNSLKRGDAAVIWDRWRLVRGNALYDIKSDPAQKTNVAAQNPEIAARMSAHYDRWWSGVEARINDFVPSHIGSRAQDSVMLCCSEWQDVRCDGKESVRRAQGGPRGGPWNILVEKDGTYEIELRRWPKEADVPLRSGVPEAKRRVGTEPEGKALPIAAAHISAAGQEFDHPAAPGDKGVTFRVNLKAGKTKLHGWFRDDAGADLCGAYFAYARRQA